MQVRAMKWLTKTVTTSTSDELGRKARSVCCVRGWHLVVLFSSKKVAKQAGSLFKYMNRLGRRFIARGWPPWH